MLTYEEFEQEIKKALERKYPNTQVVKQSRYKFNQIKKGFVIEGLGSVQPIVYPDNLYEAYQRYEDMELVIQSIDIAIECEKVEGFKDIVKDWEQAKEYIYPYIVNIDKNQLCLECNEYVYKPKLDFAYGVFVEIPDDDGQACVNITEKMLELWDVSEAEVFEIAERNAKYYVKPMRQVIAELTCAEFSEEDFEEEAMYVVTSKTRNRGAAAIFDYQLLRNTAEELQADFFIIPSSLHEIILVKEESVSSKQTLKEIVHDVNQSQVSDDEFLSDNVYYYSREEHQVRIVDCD